MRPNWNTGQVSDWTVNRFPGTQGINVNNVLMYVIPGVTATSDVGPQAQQADRIDFFSFVVNKSISVDAVRLECTTSAASGEFRIGIYNVNENGAPSALIQDFGAADCSSTGLKTLTVTPFVLIPGFYYLASTCNSTTIQTRRWGGAPAMGIYLRGVTGAGGFFGSRFSGSRTYGALPSSAPAINDVVSSGSAWFYPAMLRLA